MDVTRPISPAPAGLRRLSDGSVQLSRGLTGLLVVAGAIGTILRITYTKHFPLWFDETFTAVIATQPTATALVHWCLTELSGPAFYMPMWLWVQIAGASDTALRLLGLVMSVAAPFILAWRGHPDQFIRTVWAILAFLSTPMIAVATEARPYSQLFLLGCLQAISFLILMRAPIRRHAAVWSVVTATLLLTHYYSLVLSGIEVLVFLVVHRHTALRCWPALLVFIPVATWIAFHIHFMLSFANTLNAAIPPVPWPVLASAPLVLLGTGSLLGISILIIVVATTILLARSGAIRAVSMPEAALVGAGLLTLACLITLGVIRPGFSSRYLTPTLPALLFALAWWARAAIARYPLAVMTASILLAVGTAGTLQSRIIDPQFAARKILSFEAPSAWLMATRPQRLVFLWQSPTGDFGDAHNLKQLAGFFFQRQGRAIPVTLVRHPPADPNAAVVTAAGQGPAAIMWLRDANSPQYGRPAITRRYPNWNCHDFGADDIMIYACRR